MGVIELVYHFKWHYRINCKVALLLTMNTPRFECKLDYGRAFLIPSIYYRFKNYILWTSWKLGWYSFVEGEVLELLHGGIKKKQNLPHKI